MATFHDRYPLNVPGKYYIDAQCTDCDLCRETAPNNVKRDDRVGISYIFKQPETAEEIRLLEEGGVKGCPTEAVGNNGDKFNWKTEPIFDWNAHYKKDGVQFDLSAPGMSEPRRKSWWPFGKK
jgi:ferredoxin